MVGHVLGRDRGFLVATEFLVLCRDMVLRLQVVAWSRHSTFMSQHCFVSLSRHHDKRSGEVCLWARTFVTIKCFYVTT